MERLENTLDILSWVTLIVAALWFIGYLFRSLGWNFSSALSGGMTCLPQPKFRWKLFLAALVGGVWLLS